MRVKKNEKNRTRYRTVAFRMSESEWMELNARVLLCGRQKQDYLIDSVLHQKLVVVGNLLMGEKVEAILADIHEVLKQVEADGFVDEENLLPLRTIAELLADGRTTLAS
jgi:hypothetical protein